MKITLTVIIILFAMNSVAYGQTKTGFINAQRIMLESNRGKEIQKRLETLQKDKQRELQGSQDNIKKLEKEISSPAMDQNTRQVKSAELQEKRIRLKRYLEDAQKELQIESQKELQALEKALMPLIQEYGKANGYTIIHDITRQGIVYFNPANDITDAIIQRINNQ